MSFVFKLLVKFWDTFLWAKSFGLIRYFKQVKPEKKQKMPNIGENIVYTDLQKHYGYTLFNRLIKHFCERNRYLYLKDNFTKL